MAKDQDILRPVYSCLVTWGAGLPVEVSARTLLSMCLDGLMGQAERDKVDDFVSGIINRQLAEGEETDAREFEQWVADKGLIEERERVTLIGSALPQFGPADAEPMVEEAAQELAEEELPYPWRCRPRAEVRDHGDPYGDDGDDEDLLIESVTLPAAEHRRLLDLIRKQQASLAEANMRLAEARWGVATEDLSAEEAEDRKLATYGEAILRHYRNPVELDGLLIPMERSSLEFPGSPGVGYQVWYINPGSLDGQWPPKLSPAFVVGPGKSGPDHLHLFVITSAPGMYFNPDVPKGPGPATWIYPVLH